MAAVTQEHRVIAIDTPLGKDKLLLRSFSGIEGMSQLFSLQLELYSEDHDIEFNAILGEKATVSVELPGSGKRFFHGAIHRFMQLAGTPRFARYHAELVPKFHGLKQMRFCRIFQNMTVPQIVEEILGQASIDYELRLSRDYRTRAYCVMYRQSPADFVMHLLEDEGIYFFFKHDQNNHTMVLADSPADYAQLTPSKVEFARTLGTGKYRADDRVLSWRREMRTISGQFSLRDYNFETPSNTLEVTTESKLKDAVGTVHDYPGEYEKSSEGDEYVRVRIEEEEAQRDVVFGTSTCREFTAGHKFQLTRHPRRDQDGAYVLTSVTHSAVCNYETDQAGADYSNSFTCIPASTPFRAPRTTPKPVVEGPQTAVVVGPSGEEIYTDKYGRVKIQFHWDRRGEKNDKSSCFVRVATPLAGRNWGMVHIPRIGQEVVVDFLEGDPDRPIIIGSVYNAEQMPPYSLPANQTQSGIKSRSSKDGGAANFNELRFEDKKDGEQVYFHAERNLDSVVEKDESRDVGQDRRTKIGHDEALQVMNNREVTIAVDDTEKVGSRQDITIGANQSQKIGASRNIMIGASDSLTVAAGVTVINGAAMTLSNGGALTITNGATTTITSGGPITITAPVITLNAATVMCSGTFISAVGIVSPVYSPGVGNLI